MTLDISEILENHTQCTAGDGFAQGDVLLIASEAIPTSAKEVPSDGVVTVAFGEATGHHHSIYSDRVKMFREDGSGGGLFILAESPVDLTHQEHDTIKLPVGTYEIRLQRTLRSGLVRRVED
jgi:hypothetical protein